jgi:hypothetical protein
MWSKAMEKLFPNIFYVAASRAEKFSNFILRFVMSDEGIDCLGKSEAWRLQKAEMESNDSTAQSQREARAQDANMAMLYRTTEATISPWGSKVNYACLILDFVRDQLNNLPSGVFTQGTVEYDIRTCATQWKASVLAYGQDHFTQEEFDALKHFY